MGGYLYTLALASVMIALICAVVPASSTSHVRLLCSLCVVCLLCAPLMRAVNTVKQGELEIPEQWREQTTTEDAEQDFADVAQSVLAGQLQLLLEREFSLPASECSIYTEQDEHGQITGVTLVLSGKAIWRDPEPLAKYVEGLLGCPCRVVLD